MTAEDFQKAVETGDASAIVATLAEDVVFHSPIVFKPYQGRETVAALLGAVVRVFEDFRYVERFERGDAAALIFKARIGDRELDGIDLLRFDDSGQVIEFTVMVRPLSGATALAEAMQARLAEAG